MLQKISEITGPLGQALEGGSSSGLRHGKPASGRLLTVSSETVVGWLLAQPSVAEADRALRTSVRSSLGVEVTVEREGRFPESGPAYYVSTGCSLTIADPGQVPAAVAKIEAAMAPASREQCENWLVMLQAALSQGKRSQATTAVAFELFVSALGRYPADAAKAACEALATRPRKGGSAWFPSLPELISELDAFSSERRSLLAALKAWRLPSEAQRLDEEAREWTFLAITAEDDAIACRRADPDLSTEATEFAVLARQEAKRLRIAAHQAQA